MWPLNTMCPLFFQLNYSIDALNYKQRISLPLLVFSSFILVKQWISFFLSKPQAVKCFHSPWIKKKKEAHEEGSEVQTFHLSSASVDSEVNLSSGLHKSFMHPIHPKQIHIHTQESIKGMKKFTFSFSFLFSIFSISWTQLVYFSLNIHSFSHLILTTNCKKHLQRFI